MENNPYRVIFQKLSDAGIRYLVVGGVAVNLHGYRRFTGDIDILLALDEKNLEKMTELMHGMGYVERLPIKLKSLSDEKQVEVWLGEKGMTAYTFQSGDQLRIGIDVLAGKSLKFDEYNDRSIKIDLEEGLKIPVVSMNDLLDMKKESGRPEDMVDVEKLLQLKFL